MKGLYTQGTCNLVLTMTTHTDAHSHSWEHFYENEYHQHYIKSGRGIKFFFALIFASEHRQQWIKRALGTESFHGSYL